MLLPISRKFTKHSRFMCTRARARRENSAEKIGNRGLIAVIVRARESHGVLGGDRGYAKDSPLSIKQAIIRTMPRFTAYFFPAQHFFAIAVGSLSPMAFTSRNVVCSCELYRVRLEVTTLVRSKGCATARPLRHLSSHRAMNWRRSLR